MYMLHFDKSKIFLSILIYILIFDKKYIGFHLGNLSLRILAIFTKNFDNIKYIRKPNSHYSYLYTKHDVLDKHLSIDSNHADAYHLKEEYREFNLCGTYEEALYKIDDFIERFKNSHYVEFREFGALLAPMENIYN